MTSTPHLNELGEFLKARRAELTPRAVGLPDPGGPRRVSGLRREEVAQLASISTDYYTRLEQGRMPASAPALEAVAEALQLDGDQRRYLFGLAGKETATLRRRTVQKVQPQLRRVLDDLTTTPAIVMGRRMDVIAWNPLASALITDFAAVPEKHRNYLRILFTDPAMRTLYADWRTVARTAVAQLRMEAAKYPDDPRLTGLVGELSVQDADFRKWWAAQHVATLSVGTKVLHHPVAGELSLDWDTLTASTDPDQQLVVWTAEVGSPTYDGLRILASWAADRQLPAAPAQ
ncbi:XRE family transcriptional regulator [Streptomyces pluripotens]|uniref:XRE family transcriptional regulator n=1 Tax=Streptomyces pluripotens TaxID=1355015 RepID=A0A221NT11_9ACTN|nr:MULTISPECIES: helix-turn-helix transcriptional regulator [Streptomyces]ARP68819.1 transcriptional regulator [Streptomyces pluripotens]ASN23074.1 XRE family transcriptional regulator [Streptomyces pluripotens]KIE27785.1 XRE family transcriptional regulator [Streptomyces sp. MUSC 125]